MRLKFGAFSRYRPRGLTLIVLMFVTAPTVLANLSPGDIVMDRDAYKDVEYGWPFSWYWRNVTEDVAEDTADLAEDTANVAEGTAVQWFVNRYNWLRLAGNLAIGFVMLVAAGVACECLLRRYRPRLRWSLKTMFAAVGVAAVFCAWCSALRNRANVQDSLITAIEERYGGVWLERWGPEWLDLVGADRFRRRIIGTSLTPASHSYSGDPFDKEVAQHLDSILHEGLGRLPDFRRLDILLPKWTPGLAVALGNMVHLRILHIDSYFWCERIPDEVLAAIGKLNQLEVLRLSTTKIPSDGLAQLTGLTNLKSLCLNNYDGQYTSDQPGKRPLLAHLPALPQLEALRYDDGIVGDRDVRQLALLPGLRSLDLGSSIVTDAAWAELPSLESLEELVIRGPTSAAGLESLLAIKRLKVLYIGSGGVKKSEVDRCSRALETLRQSGIAVNPEWRSFEERSVLDGCRLDEYPPPADRGLPTDP